MTIMREGILSTMCEWLTCSNKLAVALILRLDKVRQNVLVAPANRSVIRPLVIVVSTTSQVLHVVQVARAAEASAKCPVALLQYITNVMLMYCSFLYGSKRRRRRKNMTFHSALQTSIRLLYTVLFGYITTEYVRLFHSGGGGVQTHGEC